MAGMITDSYKSADGIIDYKMVWIIPAGIAFVVFLLFTFFFNDKKTATVAAN